MGQGRATGRIAQLELVTIASIAAGGDGVGRLADGRAAFVPRTAPGDAVEIELVEVRPRFVRGRIARMVQPSTARVAPLCPHYDGNDCGACQLQHLDYPAQLSAKARIVGDALRRIARREVADPEIVAAPAPFAYRNRITLHRSAEGVIGYHPWHDPAMVFAVRECRIATPALNGLIVDVQRLVHLLPDGPLDLVLREASDGELHLILRPAVGAAADWNIERFQDSLSVPASVWVEQQGRAGPDAGMPPLAFEQVNRELGDRIRQEAIAHIPNAHGAVVWDLYCGQGDAARELADRGSRVHAVDSDAAAVGWASVRASGATITWWADAAEKVAAALPVPTAVLANPPRSGMHRELTRILDEWGRGSPGRRLVYVSCDPATLARDVSRLPAFAVARVVAFDLFPQTAHVETLMVLES